MPAKIWEKQMRKAKFSRSERRENVYLPLKSKLYEKINNFYDTLF